MATKRWGGVSLAANCPDWGEAAAASRAKALSAERSRQRPSCQGCSQLHYGVPVHRTHLRRNAKFQRKGSGLGWNIN
jgi:hypothetical protein